MITTQTIDWKPFSEKHKQYIKRALTCRMSVAEGAIRSGKTIDHCIIAAAYLEKSKDRIHLASGSTVANAKLNIGDCNGFGLEYLFRGRCRWGKFKGNECLYIDTQTGEKIVIFAGGGLSNSYKKILGNSYGLWIATEINQHYDSNDSETSFIKVATGRQVAAYQPMTLWDLNPSAPKHPIYAEYIDKYANFTEEEDQAFGGYNYAHFTIADNLSLSDERKKQIETGYNKSSIWYKRDILGLRCVAEGLVYQQFADTPENYIVDDINKDEIVKINIGVDFGGSGSATTFVAVGFMRGFKKIVPLMSERHAEMLNPEQLNKVFAEFCENVWQAYQKVCTVYADSAEQVLIRGLRVISAQKHLKVNIMNAQKNPIMERIRLVNKLIAQNRFNVLKYAQTVIDALQEALWDIKKEDTRLDDGATDIDTLDALEYAIEPEMYNLTLK